MQLYHCSYTLVAAESPEIEALFRAQRRRLWGLAYRLTGSAEDAEDVVQEAFVRLLAQPPPLDAAGPRLARVTPPLAIDALRRRRRRAYTGPWLPSPVETGDADPLELVRSGSADPEA